MKRSSSKRGRGGREARQRRRRKLAAEARSVRQRLKSAVAPNFSGPVLGRANIVYELSERSKALSHGGMGIVAKLVRHVRLAEEVDNPLNLVALHKPYYEPDHVLNIAYDALCGGRRLEDIELRRADQVFLDGIGAPSLPDPTTAGDFCRRFGPASVMALQEAVNRARLRVWAAQAPSFLEQTARIDADATIVPTGAEAKEGIDIAYSAQLVVMCSSHGRGQDYGGFRVGGLHIIKAGRGTPGADRVVGSGQALGLGPRDGRAWLLWWPGRLRGIGE